MAAVQCSGSSRAVVLQALPKEEAEFFDLLRTYFPCVYDIKYLMKSCENLKGGLQKVAEKLQVCDHGSRLV